MFGFLIEPKMKQNHQNKEFVYFACYLAYQYDIFSLGEAIDSWNGNGRRGNGVAIFITRLVGSKSEFNINHGPEKCSGSDQYFRRAQLAGSGTFCSSALGN